MLQELYRQIRAILNKLTPQKFKTLVKQCTSLQINTEERLKGSIDIIFEKVRFVFSVIANRSSTVNFWHIVLTATVEL